MTKTKAQRILELEDELRKTKNELADARKMNDVYQKNCITAQRPRFLLAKFTGQSGSVRRMFDAHVIEVGVGHFFGLNPGYQGIEVDVQEINR